MSKLLSAAVLVVGLVGCASGPAWRPGAPDSISQDPDSRYPAGYMADKYMEILDSGPRYLMLGIERDMIEIDPGPNNNEPWKGAKLP